MSSMAQTSSMRLVRLVTLTTAPLIGAALLMATEKEEGVRAYNALTPSSFTKTVLWLYECKYGVVVWFASKVPACKERASGSRGKRMGDLSA